MSDDLITVQLTVRQAKALMRSASMLSHWIAQMNPEWESHVEPDGEVPALTSGILALEMTLACGAES